LLRAIRIEIRLFLDGVALLFSLENFKQYSGSQIILPILVGDLSFLRDNGFHTWNMKIRFQKSKFSKKFILFDSA